MKALITAFARNRVFANIVLLILFGAGALAAYSMIRENFPEFSLDMITITVVYPGADPEEVEEGISRKIETALEGLEGIKQYTTTSMENMATAMIEVREGQDAAELLNRVRSRVEAIATFPPAAERPIIEEVLLRDVVMFLYLTGEMSERRLKEWTENTKDEIQLLPEISQVEIFGARDYEISIELSEPRLREYGLSLGMVADAVRRGSLNLAGGTIRTLEEEIRVRTMGRRYTGEELADLVVLARPGGELVTLDRIATIRDGFTEDPIRAAINGEPANMIFIYKTSDEDALAISRSVHAFVEDRTAQLPPGSRIAVLYDGTTELKARISLLTRNGMIGLALVFILLWLFMDIRLSFWSGMGIPVSIAGALMIMWAMGITLNMISLFALIMVLGIVVDNAIVVGEAIFVKRQQGLPPIQAAVEGVGEVGLPVFASAATTVVAFIPLMYIGGIMGKFIFQLPVVVIACLLISLVECLILLPAHLNNLPDPNRADRAMGALKRGAKTVRLAVVRGLEWFMARIYTPVLRLALQWRYIAMCMAISLLFIVLGMVRGGLLKFEVFPEIDGYVMTAIVHFPDGTPAEVTHQAIERIEAALERLSEQIPTRTGEPLLKDRMALVGQTFEQIPATGPHVGSVLAVLLASEQRGVHTKDLMIRWEREVGAIPGIRSLTFEGMAAGPPGAPIEVWLQGHDMPTILSATDALMERLRRFDGVYQIRSDFSPGKNEIRLALKPEARALGLTVDDLARQVYAGYFGEEALRVQRGRDDVRVKVRYTEAERSRISDLPQMRIRTREGYEIPLRSVAEVQYAAGYSRIIRTDGMRRVAVSAAVDGQRANTAEILADLQQHFFPQLHRDHPGLYVSVQGEQEKMRESFESIYISFPLAMMGILVIMATVFRSYAQPLVIMFTVPFGIIGAIAGHLLLGYTLTLMSVFGMVALAGVVVNNAIVMIERINEYLAEGFPFREAVRLGAMRRFRAILLTTVSTVFGLTPLILETDLQAKFLIPMAISIAAGVLFATVLTLVLIPSLLMILNDLRRTVHWFRHRRLPTREAVEPAAFRRLETQAPLSAPDSQVV
ncbi:efflux RND transporter permease subunit [Desulfatitalea alkaliphila]|uniref:Efflux RND transporter permease subunit n=1 Tax=Desulfatitalea alkaliphila TaxID=2929485 RepID=A0AA41UIR6_9BACT|nr:efflux RND transporter permease subunit [Desulfatitalea alkaliphila]